MVSVRCSSGGAGKEPAPATVGSLGHGLVTLVLLFSELLGSGDVVLKCPGDTPNTVVAQLAVGRPRADGGVEAHGLLVDPCAGEQAVTTSVQVLPDVSPCFGVQVADVQGEHDVAVLDVNLEAIQLAR